MLELKFKIKGKYAPDLGRYIIKKHYKKSPAVPSPDVRQLPGRICTLILSAQ